MVFNCCRQNLITLPEIPNDVITMSCADNQLTIINDLPENLILLYCNFNRITSMVLPKKLEKLYCYNNQLTQLPTLPDTLITLMCSDNQLTSLPELPDSLVELDCSDNYLTQLPMLPKNLKALYCHNNNKLTIYPDFEIKTINQVNRFRFLYYSLKYVKRLFRYLLKKRMDKHRDELVYKAIEIMYRPSVISDLVSQFGITMNTTYILSSIIE